MKINFDYIFKDLKGNEMSDVSNEQNKVTLGSIAAQALVAMEDGDRDGAKKANRYYLAMKVIKGGIITVTSEEILMIKEQIGRLFSPLVVGQAYSALENDND